MQWWTEKPGMTEKDLDIVRHAMMIDSDCAKLFVTGAMRLEDAPNGVLEALLQAEHMVGDVTLIDFETGHFNPVIAMRRFDPVKVWSIVGLGLLSREHRAVQERLGRKFDLDLWDMYQSYFASYGGKLIVPNQRPDHVTKDIFTSLPAYAITKDIFTSLITYANREESGKDASDLPSVSEFFCHYKVEEIVRQGFREANDEEKKVLEQAKSSGNMKKYLDEVYVLWDTERA